MITDTEILELARKHNIPREFEYSSGRIESFRNNIIKFAHDLISQEIKHNLQKSINQKNDTTDSIKIKE